MSEKLSTKLIAEMSCTVGKERGKVVMVVVEQEWFYLDSVDNTKYIEYLPQHK
jgi:hypothetical protein